MNTVLLNACDPELHAEEEKALLEQLGQLGHSVSNVRIDATKLRHCTGCFGCWVKTPGECVQKDSGNDIARQIINADVVIRFSPISFGGFSSNMKIIIDRQLPLILPYFETSHVELHHVARYKRRPFLISIGIQEREDAYEAALYKAMAARNAINFHNSKTSSCVLVRGMPAELISQRIREVLTKKEAIITQQEFLSLTQDIPSTLTFDVSGKKALLLVGSPKPPTKSNSLKMGEYLMGQLANRGWSTSSTVLNIAQARNDEFAALSEQIGQNNLVVLSFPLYIDTLPYLVIRCLEGLAQIKHKGKIALAVLCNCGFPEAEHNRLAVAIVRQFAVNNGFTWAGSLCVGAGEAVIDGKDLSRKLSPGELPPIYLKHALDLGAEALDQGLAIGLDAQSLASRSPIPKFPMSLWKFIFKLAGSSGWKSMAKRNGLVPRQMLARPYQA